MTNEAQEPAFTWQLAVARRPERCVECDGAIMIGQPCWDCGSAVTHLSCIRFAVQDRIETAEHAA